MKPCLLKHLQQFSRGKEAQCVNLTRVSSARGVTDLVIKMETRNRAFNLHTTDSRHAEPIRLARLSCNARRVESARCKPGLDDDDAVRRNVIAKAGERAAYSIEGLEIADRTEKA